jgi:hypothetical protein
MTAIGVDEIQYAKGHKYLTLGSRAASKSSNYRWAQSSHFLLAFSAGLC